MRIQGNATGASWGENDRFLKRLVVKEDAFIAFSEATTHCASLNERKLQRLGEAAEAVVYWTRHTAVRSEMVARNIFTNAGSAV